MHIKGYDEEAWNGYRRLARLQVKKSPEFKIIASDLNKNAIWSAKENAKTAGVDHLIDFELCDFRETPLPEAPGIVMMNPEYGERLGADKDLEELYASIGDFFKKRCGGYTGIIFTGNLDLAKRIGLRTSLKIPFYNARIECRLLKYELYQGTKRIRD